MAKGYDLESLLDDMLGLVQAHYNAKLSQLDSEKADGITLKPVGSGAYFLQSLNNEIINYDPFILYGVDQVQSEGIGSATRKTYTINISLILNDSQNDPAIVRRMLRYSRALEEMVNERFSDILNTSILKVESLEPIRFKLLNSSADYRAVGVLITVEIA